MTNKLMLALLAGVLFVPAYAANDMAAPAREGECPFMAQRPGEFKKAQKEHRAKMKATEEKMEKLVKEYGKLTGKKQEAKKAEIATEVEKIHEEQLNFKAEQLDKFARRLDDMRARLAEEQSADGKKAWVDEKTDELIKANGDLKVLFERPEQGQFGPGMHDGKFGPKPGKGFRRGHFKGPKPGEGPGFDNGDPRRAGINPPPPPPLEEK